MREMVKLEVLNKKTGKFKFKRLVSKNYNCKNNERLT